MNDNNKDNNNGGNNNGNNGGGGDIIFGDKNNIDNRGGNYFKFIKNMYGVPKPPHDEPDDIIDAEVVSETQTEPQPTDAIETPEQGKMEGHEQGKLEETEAADIEEEPRPQLSLMERIKKAICAVHLALPDVNDYSYKAIYFYLLERKILDVLSLPDFEKLLRDSGAFDPGKEPKENNMKPYIIKGTFPNWLVRNKKYTITEEFVEVARCFEKAFREA